jgi:hypothetical protein
MMTGDEDYAEWIKTDPPPDLQELVKRFGGYSNITPQAWAENDAAMLRWQERRRLRTKR